MLWSSWTRSKRSFVPRSQTCKAPTAIVTLSRDGRSQSISTFSRKYLCTNRRGNTTTFVYWLLLSPWVWAIHFEFTPNGSRRVVYQIRQKFINSESDMIQKYSHFLTKSSSRAEFVLKIIGSLVAEFAAEKQMWFDPSCHIGDDKRIDKKTVQGKNDRTLLVGNQKRWNYCSLRRNSVKQ